MEIALKAPAELDLDALLATCRDLRVHIIEIAASTIEAHLGKPTVPAWWLEMPENGFETGALPLEEEILQDEVDLARRAFGERLRAWRASLSPAPLDRLRRRFHDARVRIASVSFPELAAFADSEVDYAFALTKALGADALATPLVIGEPRRLAPFADRHALRVAFQNAVGTRPAGLEAALAHSPRHALSLDISRWVAAGHGSPLALLRQRAVEVIQIHVDAAGLTDASAAEPIREVLLDIMTNGWSVLVTLGVERDSSGELDRTAAASAIDYCLNGLRLST